MAVELDKIKKETSIQIQELQVCEISTKFLRIFQDEIANLLNVEEDQKHVIENLQENLMQEQVNMGKMREDYELKIDQWRSAYDKVEYDLGQAKMEVCNGYNFKLKNL